VVEPGDDGIDAAYMWVMTAVKIHVDDGDAVSVVVMIQR
jgi:hypothetical protein